MGNKICNCNKENDEGSTEFRPEETIEGLVPTDENCERDKINQSVKHDRRLPAKYKAGQYVLDEVPSEDSGIEIYSNK